MWYILVFVAALATATPSSPLAKPDLTAVENEQKLLLHDLQHSQAAAAELKDKLDKIQQSKNSSDSTLNVANLVVNVGDPTEDVHKDHPKYTAPIIVMLPEAPSDREKWEYALTLRCLGQPNFNPFENIHNSKMMEMATIKGHTIQEIKHEIHETENELKESKSELSKMESTLASLKDDNYADRTKKLHVSHNIKLVKHEIDVMETKLGRLQKRLNAAVLFGKKSSGKGSEHDEDGETEEGQEEDNTEEFEEPGEGEDEDHGQMEEENNSEESQEGSEEGNNDSDE
ncbi:tropomyosin 1 alpha, putative [Babesia ovis]|uniref:Tropomyosin 1 alpha, putative n=1 Tax=Babesia ovis TaxID=5869 RepID=A0A9W5TBR2_BABOV|nr:tropomyosin 1 alpha, putative [Babesia ovis]